MTVIDRTTYDKTLVCAANEGYWLRTDGVLPTKIVVHTMNGNIGSSWDGECRYIQSSVDIGVHYAVGKLGQCARFLQPKLHIAWAVGTCIPGWSNAETISIENHYTPGEQWTAAMHQTLSDLVLELCGVYPIGDLTTHMATHRAVALPVGRKEDPSGWSDLDFGTWRASLQCQRSHP